MVLTSLVLSLCLVGQEYENIYEETEGRRSLPPVSFSSGYAYGLTNTSSNLHSITANAQARVWKYISTGIFYHHIFPSVNESGKRLEAALEPVIQVSIPQPLLGVYSLTELQMILGRWNIFNTFDLDVELLTGGGLGMTRTRADTHLEGKNKFSYLWMVEQRSSFSQHLGVQVSLFGHTGGTFLGAGLYARW